MAIRYTVKKTEHCPDCSGDGMVPHPIWTQFYQENGTGAFDREAAHKWFEEHGYHKYRDDVRTDGFPDEEIVCRNCDGRGVVENEVDLEEALIALGVGQA